MTRYFLLALFVAMIGSRALGLDFGLAPGLSVKNAMIYGALLLIAIEGGMARNRRPELLPVLVPFALLIGYALLTWLLTVLFVDNPYYLPRETLIRLKVKLVDQFIILLVFFYGVVTFRDALWTTKAILWVLAVGCLITVVDTFNIPDLGIIAARDQDGRIEGIIGSAAESSTLWAFFVPAFVALWSVESGSKKRLALLGIALALVSILVSGTRGPILGLVAGALIAAVLLRRHIPAATVLRATGVMFVLAAATSIVVLASDLGDLLQRRLLTGLETGELEAISSGRTKFWFEALRDMISQPLTFITGFGWEAYYQTPARRIATHSVYLDLLYNLGFIGLGFFLLAFANAILIARRGLQYVPDAAAPFLKALVFGVCSILISMAFADLEAAAPYAWAYVGLLMRVTYASRTPQREVARRSRSQMYPTTRPTSETPRR